jgi:TolB-like protein
VYKLSQLWQELKRRKVTRVITVYAAAAFVILELTDIVAPSLGLPDWTLNLIIILLVAGFIIAAILSWIYDIKPEGGVVKTEPAYKVKYADGPVPSNNWKIASIISFAVIVSLIVLNVVPRKGQSEESFNSDTSIGVLPFENLSGDPENEPFCDGMTEAVISRLSLIKGIGKVIPRTSMMRYKKTDKTISEIAAELNVTHILETGFQKSGNDVKINLKLIEAPTEKTFWSEEHRGKYDEIFEIQADVAEIVASKLNVDISVNELANIRKSMTENVDAYNLYLKGIYKYRTYTNIGIHQAIEYMMRAINLDSTFALAYTGLAISQIARGSVFTAELNGLDALAIGKPLIDKALSLDPDLEEAHLWNGFYLLYNNWDFSGAEQEYKKAIINDHPEALAIYTDFLNFSCRHQEALVLSERLNNTNPYYPNTRMILSLYYSGKLEAAAEYGESRIELYTSNFIYDTYGFLMLNSGKYERAVQLFQRSIEINKLRTPRMVGWMGAAYARMGNQKKSVELIEELKAKRANSTAGSTAFFIAVIYSALEDKASALLWLQDAYENHEMEIPWLKTEPQFYTLHDEPAFQSLIEMVGFPNTGGVEETEALTTSPQ